MKKRKETNLEVFCKMSADLDWDSMMLGQKPLRINLENYNLSYITFSRMIRQSNENKYCTRKLRIKSMPPEILVYAEMYDEK